MCAAIVPLPKTGLLSREAMELSLFTENPRELLLGNWMSVGAQKGRGVENPDRKVGLGFVTGG
jgi:hypothetical protein